MYKITSFSLKKFVEWRDDLLHLIYPSLCLLCEKELSRFENSICGLCYEDLKYTNFEQYQDETSLDKLFYGRVLLKQTFALLYFEKGNQTQRILHEIKYHSNKNLGKQMGRLMGEKILSNPAKYQLPDALIPIPLHPKKEYLRGYNQSEVLADGISLSTGIPVNTTFLSRVQHSESQTKKNKFLRWDTIEEAFFVNVKGNEQLQHVALIDDVVTTGSTLEASIKKILEIKPDMTISVFSLAVTK